MKKINKIAETNNTTQIPPPRFSYDIENDVMYITFGDPEKCKTVEMGDGLLCRYSGKKLNGITIVNYKRRVK